MDLSSVNDLAQKAMKLGAPKNEAFILAISRAQCQVCKEWDFKGGTCSAIRNHRDKINYEKFSCDSFRRIEKKNTTSQ